MMALRQPRTRMTSLHPNDMKDIPALPRSTLEQEMREEAEPVSRRCCSSMRLVPGARMRLPQKVAGSKAMANAKGPVLPKAITDRPATPMTM